MPVIYRKYTCWDDYGNPAYKPPVCYDRDGAAWEYYPYKLHISIMPLHFNLIKDQLKVILYDAVDKLVIPAYKVFRMDIGTAQRQRQIPFVIYLYHQPTMEQKAALVRLYREVEELLQLHGIKSGDSTKISRCDLPLPGHFIFRQTALKTTEPYEYLDAYDEENIEKLRTAGLQATYYHELKALFAEKPKLSNTKILDQLSLAKIQIGDNKKSAAFDAKSAPDKVIVCSAQVAVASSSTNVDLSKVPQILMPMPMSQPGKSPDKLCVPSPGK